MTNPLLDKTFMFTGRLLMTRKEAQKDVEIRGGIAGHSLVSSTDFLVVGESPGSKLFRAEGLGVPTITDSDFYQMLDNTPILTISLSEPSPHEPEETPDPDTLSFKNKEVLMSLMEENPDLLLWPGQTCSLCSHEIPYSIHPDYFYCFTCRKYFTPVTDEVGNPMLRVGSIKDVSDFYTLTKPLLLLVHPIEDAEIEVEGGKYLTNHRGRIIFLSSAELCKTDKLNRIRDYCNSAEFVAETRKRWSSMPQRPAKPSAASLHSSEELEELQARFEASVKRKENRPKKERKKRERKIDPKLLEKLGLGPTN